MKQIEPVSQEKRSGSLPRQMPVPYLALGAVFLLPLGFVFASGIPSANSTPRASKQTAAQQQPKAQRQVGVVRPRFAGTFPTPVPTARPTPTPTPEFCDGPTLPN